MSNQLSNLNKKVAVVFNKREITAEVGVEIEIEATNNIPSRESFEDTPWQRVRDGSLRGYDNAEFVFRNPLKEADALEAVDTLSSALDNYDTALLDSVRTGVHVHINVQSMTMKQMWTFVTCYYILEEILTDFCGEGRQGNHFCLRAMDADAVVARVASSIARDDTYPICEESVRYAALNFNALHKFGSLEFRQLRTPMDFEKVKTWIKVLLSVKRNSEMYPNPQAVVENFSFGGEVAFMRAMLGEHVHNFNIDNDKLRRGVRIAQDIAYAKEEWN